MRRTTTRLLPGGALAIALTFGSAGPGVAEGLRQSGADRSPTPAHSTATSAERSSAGGGYVDGYGYQLSDDLNDEPTLQWGSRRSNWVGMWQAILWADGFLPYSGIDCTFGPKTHEATKQWQENFVLKGDGIVGPKTRAVAGGRLVQISIPARVRYYGSHNAGDGTGDRHLTFKRGVSSNDGGLYSMYNSPGLKLISWNYTSLKQC